MEIRADIQVRQVSLKDIRTLVNDQRSDIYTTAQGSAYRKPMVYLHLSAGWHDHIGVAEGHYQFCIAGDGLIYMPAWAYNNLMASDSNGNPMVKATWRRNTGSISIAMLAGVNAVCGGSFGDNPPTDEQIESMSQIVAIICDVLGVPPTFDWVRTHAEQADQEGDESYGPETTCERWDGWYFRTDGREGTEPGSGGNVIRGKAAWYINEGVGN